MMVPCPICGESAAVSSQLRDWLYGISPYLCTLFSCPGCGVRFQHPMPDRELAATFYGSGYWQETGRVGALKRLQDFYVNLHLRLDLMGWVKRLKLHKGARIVDVGCSRGDWLALMAAKGYAVSGVEGDERAAAFARQHHHLDVVQDAAETWSPDPSSFDAITAFHVLEHMGQPSFFLETCHRALRHNGRLLLRVPNSASWQAALFGDTWKGLEPPRHLINYTPKALKRLLANGGFEVEKMSTWSLRDGPPAWSSSAYPRGEPTYQLVHGRMSHWRTLIYLALTTLVTPVEFGAAILQRGGMITVIARKRTAATE